MVKNKDMVKKSKKIKFTKKTLLLAGLAAIVLAGILFFVFHQPNKGSGVIPSKDTSVFKPSQSTKSTTTPTAPSPAGSTSPKYAASGATANGTLVDPTGTFVSNHSPSLSGNEAQQSEQSVCNTTPGASCYIQFTKDSVIKTLKVQTTDASGATYWSWNINDSGFTEGTWKVMAIATLNGQTKTASDGIDLVVHP